MRSQGNSKEGIVCIPEGENEKTFRSVSLSTDDEGHEHRGKGTPEGGQFVSKGEGGESKTESDKPKRAAPGSQIDEETRNKLKTLGMHGSLPPSELVEEGPFKGMSSVVEGSIKYNLDDPNIPWLMSWNQRTKSGRISGQYRYTKEFLDSNADDKHNRVRAVDLSINNDSRTEAEIYADARSKYDNILTKRERNGP